MSFHYVATGCKPSAVYDCIECSFLEAKKRNLILNKGTLLEVYSIDNDDLEFVMEIPIYGRVSILKSIRMANQEVDWLIIITERYWFTVLQFKNGEIITKANGDLRDEIGRRSESILCCMNTQFLAISITCGLMKIIPVEIKSGEFKTAFNCRLEESKIIRMIRLLDGVLILYENMLNIKFLRFYAVDISEKEFKQEGFNLQVENSCSLLMLVNSDEYLTVSNEFITLYKGKSKLFALALDSFEPVRYILLLSFNFVNSNRFLIGQSDGTVSMLFIDRINSTVDNMHLQTLVSLSFPTCLAMFNETIYIGSQYGDSYLLSVRGNNETSISRRYSNMGPVLDFCIVDMVFLLILGMSFLTRKIPG